MRADDVRVLVEVVARDPVMSPRYRGAEGDLETALLQLLGAEALLALVFHCAGDDDDGLAGFGISAFVSDEFARLVTTPPFLWAGRELATRVARGDSPVLSNTELRRRNEAGGLNAFVWMAWLAPRYRSRLDVLNGYMTAFIEHNRGFQIKELISQNDQPESLESSIRAGGLILTNQGMYTDVASRPPSVLVMEPHCMHVTREMALSRAASWVSTLFVYRPPRVFFSAGQQRLLLAAMGGGTDDELAHQLHISLSGVKKTWRQIYQRAAGRLPDWTSDDYRESPIGERGKGKKQRLLVYLRDHPEELRPLPRRKQPSG